MQNISGRWPVVRVGCVETVGVPYGFERLAVVVFTVAPGANVMPQVNPLARELVFKVVYYGPGLGGKTTSLQHVYAATRPEHRGKMVSLATPVDRTLYFDFLPIRLPTSRDMTVRLQLFTVPGQVYYNATRKLVLTGADGVVFVADSQLGREDSNLESFRNLEENLAEHGRGLDEMPHVFSYNKRDMLEVSPVEEMEQLLNARGAPSFATVATTGEGVFEALEAITRAVLEDFEMRVPEHRGLAPTALAMPEGGLAEALRLMDGAHEVWDTPASSTLIEPSVDTESGLQLPADDDAGEQAARLIVEPLTRPGIGLSSVVPSSDSRSSRWRPLPVPLNGVGMRSSPPSAPNAIDSDARELSSRKPASRRFDEAEPVERKSLARRLEEQEIEERESREREMAQRAVFTQDLTERKSLAARIEERERAEQAELTRDLTTRKSLAERLEERERAELRSELHALEEPHTAVSGLPNLTALDAPPATPSPVAKEPESLEQAAHISDVERAKLQAPASAVMSLASAEATISGTGARQIIPPKPEPEQGAVCSLSLLWPDDEVNTVERVELAIAQGETRDATLLVEILIERCLEDLANRLGKSNLDAATWSQLLGLGGDSYLESLRLVARAKSISAQISKVEALRALLFATNLCVAKRRAIG